MILSLFEWLSNALYQNPFLSLTAAFFWGILSVLLSPCHLASIPLIVGFIDDQGQMNTKRAFVLSVLFSLGILVTICIVGLVTSLMGRMLGDLGSWSNYFVSIIFFIVGAYLLGLVPLNLSAVSNLKMKKKGFIAAFLLGLIFGLALGPCTFAYMAPVMGVCFSLASSNLFFAICLIIVYGIGHSFVIVFAGTFSEVIQKFLNWDEHSKGTIVIKKICGVFVLLGGIYMIYTAR